MIKKLMKFLGVQVAIVGIIIEGNKVLLTKRSKVGIEKNKWCLPGGRIKKWESAEEAIRREIKEEIGYNIKETKFLFYHDEFFRRLNLHALVLVFIIDLKGTEKLGWEVSESRLFNKNEIEKLDMAYTHREILNKFFKMKK